VVVEPDCTRTKGQERKAVFISALKAQAQSIAIYATRTGKMPKAAKCACVHCGEQARENHHEDYAKPLEVMPLCKKCHVERHKQIRRENASKGH